MRTFRTVWLTLCINTATLSANVITFSSAPMFGNLSQSSEDGFTYRTVGGVLLADYFNYGIGNSPPVLTAGNPGTIFAPGGGTLQVVRSGGGGFTFTGIDIEEADGGVGPTGASLDQIIVSGYLRGVLLARITLTPIQATQTNFVGPFSHAGPGSLAGLVLDELRIQIPAIRFGIGGAQGSIDNVGLTFATLPDPPAAPSPEPATGLIAGSALAAMCCWNRRKLPMVHCDRSGHESRFDTPGDGTSALMVCGRPGGRPRAAADCVRAVEADGESSPGNRIEGPYVVGDGTGPRSVLTPDGRGCGMEKPHTLPGSGGADDAPYPRGSRQK